MNIDAKWLDEQIKTATQDGDRHTQLAFMCQGVVRMAQHVKARLAEPEPKVKSGKKTPKK